MLGAAWSSRAAPWAASTFAIGCLAAVAYFVDVSPKVEGDFFFAEDDPQMRASEEVAERFPSGTQLILRVADRAGDHTAYRSRVASLTRGLVEVDGVEGGFSITTDDASRSPLFGRMLLTPDPDASNIILTVDDTDPEILLPRLEAVVAAHESSALEVVMSGVPAIVELIRRSLYRDLIVFSGAAVLVFALLAGVVYRDAAIVVGMLATCSVSVSVTLMIVQGLGVPIGLLTANLVTIVFVLTLSHIVFLTANWTAAAVGSANRATAITEGITATWEASFWSMTTTLLGFLSLLVATARPLRELGIAGAVGTVTALIVTYGFYPAFLGRWARAREVDGAGPLRVAAAESSGESDAAAGRAPGRGAGKLIVPAIGLAVAVLAFGVPSLQTDPGLLTYFSEGSQLRDGLAQIDADGGSSTLDIVVRDPGRGRVDSRAVFGRLESLQAALETDPAVGVVLSPTVLIGHARTIPLAGILPIGMLLDIASGPTLDRVALGFVTPERDEARFSLRMHETDRPERAAVMSRLREAAVDAGLEPVLVAGLYDLQAQLGRLIGSSLRIGIGGLLLLFIAVAAVVSRSWSVTGRMWVCLAAIPTVILGTFGHLAIAVDIITSPAANIALAIGADSMIHLVVRARRMAAAGESDPWGQAVRQVRRPVLGATVIICAGFGIFTLSAFPPTQRFGFGVIVGTAAAATMALLVLPRLASDLARGRAFHPSRAT